MTAPHPSLSKPSPEAIKAVLEWFPSGVSDDDLDVAGLLDSFAARAVEAEREAIISEVRAAEERCKANNDGAGVGLLSLVRATVRARGQGRAK